MKLSNAPRWILEAHPIPEKDVILDYNEHTKRFFVNTDDNDGSENSDNNVDNKKTLLSNTQTTTINEIYDLLIKEGIKFKFSKKVLEKYDTTDSIAGRTIVVPARNGNLQMMFDNSDFLLLKTYLDFIQYFIDNEAKKYHENPKDFIAAYEFIDQHPAFWVKMKNSKTDFLWKSPAGIDTIWQTFYRDKDGGIVCILETGEHTKPEYLECGINPALNTYANTYEKAIILLAQSISENYQDNGDSKKK